MRIHPVRQLLTAQQVQGILHVDRSTVYRMAEDGRLPARRVGRQWRFPADEIRAMVEDGSLPPATAEPIPPAAGSLAAVAAPVTEVAAELLGVMMVVTDMHGRPVTDVANPSTWFSAHADSPDVLDACVTEWRDLADHPDLTPRFQEGALGFECARAFIRHGSTLVGMVLAGGVSPSTDVNVDPDLYHLDDTARRRVLDALPRIAAAISTTPPRSAATHPVPHPAATTKEN